MHTRVKLLEGMQMKTILKLLGGYSQIIGGIYPPHPPRVSAPRVVLYKEANGDWEAAKGPTRSSSQAATCFA